MNAKEVFVRVICLLAISALIISSAFTISGCNKQLIDLNYNFNYAMIGLPNGETVEGKVQSWTDFEDGDQIQLKIDGVTYLVHSSDVVLMNR